MDLYIVAATNALHQASVPINRPLPVTLLGALDPNVRFPGGRPCSTHQHSFD